MQAWAFPSHAFRSIGPLQVAAGGYSHELILLACERCKQHKTFRFADVAATLKDWRAHKLRGVKSIRSYEKSGPWILCANVYRMGDCAANDEDFPAKPQEQWHMPEK
ncbi:MAG: hypothetical protein ACLT0Y_03525 [Christensenellales bacterium]